MRQLYQLLVGSLWGWLFPGMFASPGWITIALFTVVTAAFVLSVAYWLVGVGRVHRALPRLPRVIIGRFGVEFPHCGDVVIWSWWWIADRRRGAFVSLGFSGNGDFGSARFSSLRELDAEWERYFKADLEAGSTRPGKGTP